jgi:2-dehydro-3-deoxygluconokinase
MANFEVKPAGSCAHDLLALDEIMLRLDPGEGRVRTAPNSRSGKAATNTTSHVKVNGS